MGAIDRDSDSRIVAAMTRPIEPTSTATKVEILATFMEFLLPWWADHPITIFICSISTLRILLQIDDRLDSILQEFQDYVDSAPSDFVSDTRHAYRSATMSTHYLAKYVVRLPNQVFWKFSLRDLGSRCNHVGPTLIYIYSLKKT